MLYSEAMQSAKVDCLPNSNGLCPTGVEGEFYTTNNMFSPVHTTWIWHQYPYTAFQAKTWLEVIHEKDPFGDEHFGAWMMYAKGSGVWFNTGKTKAFAEHQDAYNYFTLPAGTQHPNEDMSKAAAAAGYDSVQFVRHKDHVNYPCDTGNTGNPGFPYLAVEIVGVKLKGTGACAKTKGQLRSGWKASQPCTCQGHKTYLNCKEMPYTDWNVSSFHMQKTVSEVANATWLVI